MEKKSNEVVEVLENIYVNKSGQVFEFINGVLVEKTKYFIGAPNKKEVVSIKTDKGHKNIYTDKLIAMAFVPNPNEFKYIKHLDGNVSNNEIHNLKWIPKMYRKNLKNKKFNIIEDFKVAKGVN